MSIASKDHVPEFGPPLGSPSVFKKGPEFRDWLLTKLLNAEFNCHKAPDFLKLAVSSSSYPGVRKWNCVVGIVHYLESLHFVGSLSY